MADKIETGAGPTDNPKANARMVSSFQAPEEIYVDGIAGAMGRGGVLKIDLYRVSGVDRKTNTEQRRVSHRLVIPAGALPELVRVLQATAEGARKAAAAGKNKN